MTTAATTSHRAEAKSYIITPTLPSQRVCRSDPLRAATRMDVIATNGVKRAPLPDFTPPLFSNKESVTDEKFEMNGQRLKINVQIYSKNQN